MIIKAGQQGGEIDRGRVVLRLRGVVKGRRVCWFAGSAKQEDSQRCGQFSVQYKSFKHVLRYHLNQGSAQLASPTLGIMFVSSL